MFIYLIASAILVFTVFVVLLAFAFDRSVNQGTNFYPSSYELFVINIKLLFAPLIKGSGWKKLVKSSDAPELNVEALTRVLAFNPRSKHIKKFKRVCKLKEEDSDSIPILYPTVVSIYPIVCLLATPEYPFPVMGSVHVYNTTTLYRDIKETESLAAYVKPNKTVKHVKKGSEVEFLSTLVDDHNKTVWMNSSKFLVMHNQRKKIDSLETSMMVNTWNEPNESDLMMLYEDIWSLGPNASIEYAHVSQDYNPIHVSSILAKLFGFPGVIMHGLYMISRAASECQRIMGPDIRYPLEVSTKFTRPCVLPQKVTFKVYSINGNQKQLYFTIKGKSDKILLDGYLKASQ